MTPEGEFAALAASQGRGAIVTVMDGGRVGAKLLVRADGSRAGTLGGGELDEEAARRAAELMWAERSEAVTVGDALLFVDATYPAPRLVAFGAVDYTTALCRLAATCGWRPFVCDPRRVFATRERFPEAEMVVAAWPEEAFEQIGGIDRATYVCVLTHDPKLDDAALSIALRSDAAYVGAMGSSRAQETRRERLLAMGFTDDELRRLAAPIGLDLGALGPEETALSIMAEVVAVRNGREGGRLKDKDAGRIHEVLGPEGGRPVIAGCVLAAGGSARFGAEPKQLAPLDGRPLLEHALVAMEGAGLDRVVVVLGAEADTILSEVDLHGAQPVVCERWEEGQSASLACGLAAVQDAEAVVIALGDQPHLSPEAVRRVLGARTHVGAVRATYQGRPGHPVVLEHDQIPKLRDATGDVGARNVILRGLREVPCDDLGGGDDVDTPDQLAGLRRAEGGQMKLEQTFTVAAPIDKVWEALIDVERVAPCLPGAEITESDDSGTYKGNFTVKLGPTTAAYRGELQMESVDEAARTVTMKASGQDKRGQGARKATIVSVMREDGAGTAVDTTTDFTITGRLARFGRGGMIKDISNTLLRDFSRCLAENIEGGEDPGGGSDADPEPSAAEAPPEQPAPSAAEAPPARPAPMRPSQPAKPVNGLALFFSALLTRIKRLFSR